MRIPLPQFSLPPGIATTPEVAELLLYKFDIALARLTSAAVMEFTGERWPDGVVIGHAKVRVLWSESRDVAWLEEARADA